MSTNNKCERRKQSVQYDSHTTAALMNKLQSIPEEISASSLISNTKKKTHMKTKSNVDLVTIKKEIKGEIIISNNCNCINDNIGCNDNNEEDNIGFKKTKSKDSGITPSFLNKQQQPKGSYDISQMQNQLNNKQKDFKLNHISSSSFSAKKDKCITSYQRNVYSGLTAAGRNMRGDPKINQDAFMTLHQGFNNTFTYHILAVFDGHGPNGHYVSDFLKNYFTKYFTSNEGINFMKKWTCAKAKEKAECYMQIKKNYTKVEELMIKSGIEHKNSGSTGVIIAILIDIILCFNTGDSRAIYISADGQVHQISEDHKPNNPNEEKRIVKLGGKVECHIEDDEKGPFRVFSKHNNEDGLAISRSIGDFEMKEAGVISEPEYFEVSIRLNKVKAIVLGSDGIWDVLSNDDVREILEPYMNTKDSIEACKEIISIATEEWLLKGVHVDDITVIVYFS